MISQLLLLASVAIKCSSLPTTVIDEPTVQYFMHRKFLSQALVLLLSWKSFTDFILAFTSDPNGTYNFDSYANTMSTFDDKYGSLFDSLSTEPINEEDYIFSEAEIAAHEALFKRDGRQSVILDMDDTQTLLVGTQQLPMYFSLFSDMTVIPADSLAECKGQVCYNAKTNDLLSNTGRSLSGFTNFASTNIFNPVDLTVSSTIQGNIQLDQFGLGAANIVVPAAAFFVLVTTGKATTNARVEFALSTSTYAPVTYLKVVSFIDTLTLLLLYFIEGSKNEKIFTQSFDFFFKIARSSSKPSLFSNGCYLGLCTLYWSITKYCSSSGIHYTS